MVLIIWCEWDAWNGVVCTELTRVGKICVCGCVVSDMGNGYCALLLVRIIRQRDDWSYLTCWPPGSPPRGRWGSTPWRSRSRRRWRTAGCRTPRSPRPGPGPGPPTSRRPSSSHWRLWCHYIAPTSDQLWPGDPWCGLVTVFQRCDHARTSQVPGHSYADLVLCTLLYDGDGAHCTISRIPTCRCSPVSWLELETNLREVRSFTRLHWQPNFISTYPRWKPF